MSSRCPEQKGAARPLGLPLQRTRPSLGGCRRACSSVCCQVRGLPLVPSRHGVGRCWFSSAQGWSHVLPTCCCAALKLPEAEAVRTRPARAPSCAPAAYPATSSRGSNTSSPWAATRFHRPGRSKEPLCLSKPPAPPHPSTKSTAGRQNNLHASNQQSAEVDQAGSVAVELSPVRQHLSQDQLMPQHRSDVPLPKASRREMESVTAPGSSFSGCHSPFNEQPVLGLQGGELPPSDTR